MSIYLYFRSKTDILVPIPYTLKHSSRARSLRLSIHPGGSLTATAPLGMPVSMIENFIAKKANWILKKIAYMSRIGPDQKYLLRGTRREYLQYREQARELITRRLPELNAAYGLKYNRISIRNSKSRWGSCSKAGNLNFNYKLALLPAELADYVMVHELCHLKEFNHSKEFWNLVSMQVPNYKELRKKLKGC